MNATRNVRWELDFRVNLGDTGTRFAAGLRAGTLFGTRCDGCSRVAVPAVAYCERCFEPATEWVELSGEGIVESFTVVHIAPGGPPRPYVLGVMRLDGTDGLFVHYVGGISLGEDGSPPADFGPGARVRAVWAQDRTGSITDIAHFQVL
ncbi:Zn-ribbon domain-containing OB-fold protein [Nocardia fluminea]|uniref:Zn-ribbon domain-containing OB-fold protein n=1 Tax=Nocardia fluminea TaxID=134984 RepID=UPI003724C134